MSPVLAALLFATVTLSPETPLSPPVITTAPYAQHILGVASNGRDFLELWLDRRSNNPYLNLSSPAPLYVSKLDSRGRVLNPFGTKIVDSAWVGALVHTNVGYVVLWSDGAATNMMVLDDDGAPIATPKQLFSGFMQSAASNGNTIFVLHGSFSQPSLLSIFRPDGTVVAEAPLDGGPNPNPMTSLVLPDGDYALLADLWDCPGNVPCTVTATLITMSEAGATSKKPLQALSQWSKSAAEIGDGRLLLAWMNDTDPSGAARTVSFRIFDADGNPVTDAKTLQSTNQVSTSSGAWFPSVGFDGQNFLVAWQWPSPNEQSGDVRAMRVTNDGTVIDGAPMILSPTLGSAPRFASNGAMQIVTWDTLLYPTSDIDFRSTPTFDALNYVKTQTIPISSALQTEARAAGSVVVWREGDDDPSIMAAILGANPISVAKASGDDKQAPAVGASKDEYLVAWREQSRILAKRLDADGRVIDAAPIVVAKMNDGNVGFFPVSNTIAVASDGTDFLVVWPDLYDVLLGARVNAAGVVIDTNSIVVSQPPNGTPGSPRIVWNGSDYIVAWTADPSCKSCLSPLPPLPPQIFVGRITPDGKLAASQNISKNDLGPVIGLARGNDGLMLAWRGSERDGSVCTYAVPLAIDGVPRSSSQKLTCDLNVPNWPLQPPEFDLAWDGSAFVSAWTKLTQSTTSVRATRISPAGTALDAEPFDIAPDSQPSYGPALVSSSSGVTAIYDRVAPEPQYAGAWRLFARGLERFSPPQRRRATR